MLQTMERPAPVLLEALGAWAQLREHNTGEAIAEQTALEAYHSRADVRAEVAVLAFLTGHGLRVAGRGASVAAPRCGLVGCGRGRGQAREARWTLRPLALGRLDGRALWAACAIGWSG